MPFPTFDNYANFAASLVATAPSPALSGTSLIVTAGAGANFPTAPFNAVVWPSGALPTDANAEIVRVTVVSTDTFTITRNNPNGTTEAGGINRSILVGDNVAANITLKALTDMQHAIHLGNVMASSVTTSQTTASAATAITFAAVASATYEVLFVGQLTQSNTSTTGTAFGVLGPTGATGAYEIKGTQRSAAVQAQVTSAIGFAAAPTFFGQTTAITGIQITGTFTTVTTAGNISVQFGLQTAAVTATVQNASITAFRVA